MNITSVDRFHVLDELDFKMHNKIEMKSVFRNKFEKCKFKDFAPYVFEGIRRSFGVV